MSEIYPLIWFIGTGLLWAVTVVYSSRTFRAFRRRYPDVASREIPYAFDTMAHPEKALFFYRRKAVEILRSDSMLWPMRQRFVVLSILSLLLPFLGFLTMVLVALILNSRA